MATTYPKTSLSVRTVDAAQKSKTFSIGYVNPEVEDGTLKLLAEKITDLSNLSLSEIYKQTQSNITNADTDTALPGAIVRSSSPFFSDDTDTYTAALATIETSTGTLQCSINTASGSSDGATVTLSDIKNSNSFTAFLNLLNNTVRGLSPTYAKKIEFVKTTNGVIGKNNTGYTNYFMMWRSTDPQIQIILQSIYDNLIPTEGLTTTLVTSGSDLQLKTVLSN